MTGDIVSFLVLAQRPDCAVLWSEEDHGLNAATEISMPTAPSAWPRIDRRQPSPRGGRGGFDGALRHRWIQPAIRSLYLGPFICRVLSAGCRSCLQTHL